MAERTENKPYRGLMAERQQLEDGFTSAVLDASHPPQNWSVLDSEIPMKALVWWYLKIGVPALLFVAISAAICYTVVSFLLCQEINSATKQLEKEFSSSSFFQPKP